MPSIPNPPQITVTIQAMLDIGVGFPASVDNATQFIRSLNGNQALTIASNAAQLTAAVVSVVAVVNPVGAGIVVGTSVVAAVLTITKNLNEAAPSGAMVAPINLGDIMSVLGNLTAVAAASSPIGSVAALGFSISSGVFGSAGIIENNVKGGVSGIVNDFFKSAQNWTPPRDPLVLDLNGGGIQTVAIDPARPILFDMDGDGTKHATGWVAAGEAIVVRDINGNGLIDSGRELFGDATVLTRGVRAGQNATDGFQALADLDLDANGISDGKFDANDVAYASVKLWQDTNQDGISQAGELRTSTELGVASINVSGTASNINLGGGNTQAFTGSFTRTNGQAGGAGTAELGLTTKSAAACAFKSGARRRFDARKRVFDCCKSVRAAPIVRSRLHVTNMAASCKPRSYCHSDVSRSHESNPKIEII